MIRTVVPMGIVLLAAQASSALAQSGQTPPKEQAPPKPPACITQNDDFTGHKTFEVTLTNGCEQRFRCTVRAYVVNSRGPTKGVATLTLGPKSKGAAARKVYVMRLKENYGSADVSRSCKKL